MHRSNKREVSDVGVLVLSNVLSLVFSSGLTFLAF
jgi:hypothetical protein